MDIRHISIVVALAAPAAAQLDTCPGLFPNQVGCFGPPSPNSNTVGEYTQVVRADFNADGVVDFAGNVNNEVWVLPGRSPSCTAQAYRALLLPGVSQIRSMVGADFDGDGNTDLVMCTTSASSVLLARGEPDGRFGAPSSLAAPASFVAFAARFDPDALADLAVFSNSQLCTFRGDAVLGLVPTGCVTFSQSFRRADLSDFNGDGISDFACTVYVALSSVATFLGDGSGSAEPGPVLTAPGYVAPFALGDCDDDGDVDIAYRIPGFVGLGTQMRFFAGHGDGQFDPSQDLPFDPSPISALACRDVDSDGDDDFLLLSSLRIATALQTSPGVFANPLPSHLIAPFPEELPRSAFVDHDGDGELDLVVGAQATDKGAVGVHLGDGTGRFGPQTPELTHVPARAESGDIDLDGDVDLACSVDANASNSVNGVLLAFNDGAGGFATTSFLPVGSAPAATSYVRLARIDSDLLLDLVVAHAGGLTVLLNTGSGFAPFATPTSIPARGLEVADVEGDGDSDVLFAGDPGDQLELWCNDGAGNLTLTVSIAARELRSFAIGDWNSDGASDVAIAHLDAAGVVEQLSLHTCDGAGGIAATQTFLRDAFQPEVFAFDFDEDGDSDVVCREGSGKLFVWSNDGSGVFAAGVSAGAFELLRAPRTLDFDGDGDTDIVGSGALGVVSIQERRGDGAAIDTTGFLVNVRNTEAPPAVFDADGDGDLDLATAGPGIGGPRLSVLFNQRAPIAIYCSPKLNSVGCSPAITHSGAPSATSASPFVVGARLVLNRRSGLLFYGFGPAWGSFQGGTLCVAAPTHRTPLQDSAGSTSGTDCTGVYAFDFNAHIQSQVDPQLSAGQRVFAQYWMRDSASASTTNLSDAVSFEIAP